MPGRPRDDQVTRRIIGATLESLIEEGYARTTIEGIARRAGVSRPTVYKRWPQLADLIVDATLVARTLAPGYEAGTLTPPPDTGSLRGDLRALAARGMETLELLAGAGLLDGLISDTIRHPHLRRRLGDEMLVPDEAAIDTIVQRAVDRGEVDAPGDAARRVPGILVAYCMVQTLLNDAPPSSDDLDAIVDLMCDGVLPR